jgi:diguanylate cyclase (GGDEF)-like protein/PAS domain S-box-containing protein
VKEQERIKEALKESEERYRAVMEQSVEAIYLYDAETKRVLESNEAFRRMMGYTEEELIGRQIYDFIDHDKENIEANIRRSLQEKRRHIGERRYRRKDGTVIVVDTSASVISYNGKTALCAVSRDITERKRFEEALRESERRFRSLIQNASDVITILEANGTIRYDSPAIERVLGYKPEERVGTSAFEYMHPDDVERVRRSFVEALDDPGVVRPPIEFRLRHKEGGWRHIEATRTNLLDDPAVRGVVANSRDVTERKEAEEEVGRLSRRNRLILNSAGEGIYGLDREGRTTFVNPAAVALTGFEPEELIGEIQHDIVHHSHPDGTPYLIDECPIFMALRDGKIHRVDDEVFWRKDGTSFPVEYTATPIREADEITGAVVTFTDVTERKKAEKALKESEELHRAVVEQSVEAIYLFDPDSKRVLETNHAFEELIGYTAEELLGMTIYDFVAHEREDIDRNVRRHVVEERRFVGERVYRREDGRLLEVEVSATLIPYRGKEAVCVVARDVTERKRAEQALKESEGRFRQLFEQSVDALFVHDEEGRIVDCNAEACRSLGYTREELLELSVKDFATNLLSEEEKEAKRGYTLWERAVRGEPGKIVGFEENELRRKDGTLFPVEVGVGAIDYGGRRLIFASARDLTERKRAEAALAEERNLLRTLIDNMPDCIFVKDKESRFVLNNAEHARALGAPEQELLGKTDFDVFPRELAERYYADEQEVIHSGSALVDREEPVVDHEGNHRWLSTTKVPLRDGGGEISGLVGISRDITDRKALEEQLRHQAFHDPLTELPNRVLFLDRLGHAIARSGRLREPVAVLFVDLDDFKRINDSLGHEIGDRLLVEVANRLSSCVRPGDTVARLFGDEFAVLLEAPAGMEDARRVAERVQKRLQAPFAFDEREVFVNCSVGIVLDGPDRTHQPKEVLRHADLAMYVAKSRGKNRYEMFNPSMDTRVWERMELENNLRRAIEREEIEVHYQPIVELGSARVVGLEALVRWRHPERGLLAAKEFVQVAEYTGLIRPIGQLVFEKACRQAREWHERHPNREILMCVNFSVSQFAYQADLIPKVLSDAGLDPEGLRLEITERAVMDDAEFAIGKLQRLKALGMSFAIDDYGTGYSCLYYLKRMPVDSLKIDGSFVAGLGKDPGDDAIVSGTIDLAHALGLKVVAEGVETAEQSTRLQGLNCDLAQGSYFSEPLSVDEASELLQDTNRW